MALSLRRRLAIRLKTWFVEEVLKVNKYRPFKLVYDLPEHVDTYKLLIGYYSTLERADRVMKLDAELNDRKINLYSIHHNSET